LFSRAEIKETAIEILPSGEQSSSIIIEVPGAEGAAVGRTKIELIFEAKTPREVISGIKQMIKDAIAKVISELGDRVDALTFNRRINLELKRINRETGVDMKSIRHQFNTERRDHYFVRRDESPEYSGSERPACRSA
jgi:predicted regulator of amino acid metabolism with ACT domain